MAKLQSPALKFKRRGAHLGRTTIRPSQMIGSSRREEAHFLSGRAGDEME
jgi:hypothetical protein